jgi:hypothetical protein
MELSRGDIYRIIIEEYIKEENLTEAMDSIARDKMLRSIYGDKKFCEVYPERCEAPEDGRGGDTASMPKRKKPKPLSSLETMPLPPEDLGGDVESRIVNLLSKLEPEEAMDIVYGIVQDNYPQFLDTGRGKEIKGFFRQNEIKKAVLEILSEYGF